MTLSPNLPALVRDEAARWLRAWLDEQGVRPDEVGTWAVHPGGPRILSALAAGLDLDDEAMALSRRVLERYGNMSSATIGFILAAAREHQLAGPGVAVGLGPGLTVEAMLFDV